MALDRATALNAIYAALDDLNLDRPGDQQLAKAEDTLLFGDGASLDSLALVNLVMGAEQHLLEMADVELVLASEAAMSRKRSPYRSVGALADYAVEVATDAAQ
jgi:acyl carrier protein